MFEKFLAFFRRKKPEPAKRMPGDLPKQAAAPAPRQGQPRPVPNDSPPDFGATLMIRRPPLEKQPEVPAQPPAGTSTDNDKKSAG